MTGVAYAVDEAAGRNASTRSRVAFERLERALEKQGAGPFFNGAKYSLVDAGYAPFLQRYFFLDRIRPIGQIEKFPRLKAWAETLLKRPSTHSFPEADSRGCTGSTSSCGSGGCRSSLRTRQWRRSRLLCLVSEGEPATTCCLR